MKHEYAHLPLNKQREIEKIREILLKHRDKIEMLLLFGSYARGDWVEDSFVEEGVTYEYKSDYDVLVIVKDKKLEENLEAWMTIKDEINHNTMIKTPVSLIVDTVDYVNQQLEEGHYFYNDIKDDGVVLYDSGRFTLSDRRALTDSQRMSLQRDDYKHWTGKAEVACWDFENKRPHFNSEKKWNNLAAFNLHQATEALYTAYLLVVTGYKPKTHDIEKLRDRTKGYSKEFRDVFPLRTEHDRHLFDLLKRAYVDARYRKDYEITEQELNDLYERVKTLQGLVVRLCEQKFKG